MLFFLIGSVAYTQEVKTEEEKKAELLTEMKNLIKVAKEAGFSEKELMEITIQRDGESINVWQFIKDEESRMQTTKKEEVKYRDRYFTVQDISKELTSKESKKLDKLRNELILSGEKQQ